MLKRFFLPIAFYFWMIGIYTVMTSAAYSRFETGMAVCFPPYTVMVGICETGETMLNAASYNATVPSRNVTALAMRGVYPM